MYERHFTVGWADMDANGHMRNSAYLDRCSDTRVAYWTDHGYSVEQLVRERIGPVSRDDVIEYHREVHLMAPLRVTLQLAGLSADGSRMKIRNEIFREDGVLAVRVTSVVGWLDLDARRLRTPPATLLAAIEALARTDDFEVLRSSIKT